MKLVRRLLRRIVGLIPERYSGGNLDQFSPEDQQVIIGNRFRGGQ